MSEQQQQSQQQQSLHHHHHHHHHKRDGASRFKEKSLKAITRNRLIERWLKIALCVVALVMAILVVLSYTVI